MISLFVSNTDKRVTSNNGSQIHLSLNPAIVLDPSKKWFASTFEMDVVYCFANICTGVNDKFIPFHKGFTHGKRFKKRSTEEHKQMYRTIIYFY